MRWEEEGRPLPQNCSEEQTRDQGSDYAGTSRSGQSWAEGHIFYSGDLFENAVSPYRP